MTIKDQYSHNVHSSTMSIVLLECSRFDLGHWIKIFFQKKTKTIHPMQCVHMAIL
jgi:hypothetical protein